MKILTTVKRVIDPYVKIRIHPDGRGVETDHVKHVMNPFDEIALEQAIRWLDAGLAKEVIVVSIGQESVLETLRHGLALGATRAIFIKIDTDIVLSGLDIAMLLQAVVLRERPEVVLMGKQAIDDDNNQVPQMLAGLLHWPQATFASQITPSVDPSSGMYCFEVVREVDTGHETIRLEGPSIISVDLRLNEPRYASLPGIMKAKQKPIETLTLDLLNIVLKKRFNICSVTSPSIKQPGIKVASVKELVDRLRSEAHVL